MANGKVRWGVLGAGGIAQRRTSSIFNMWCLLQAPASTCSVRIHSDG